VEHSTANYKATASDAELSVAITMETHNCTFEDRRACFWCVEHPLKGCMVVVDPLFLDILGGEKKKTYLW